MADPRREYRQVMSHFATGVAVVTAAGEPGPVGMTANALCSLSLEPLQLLVCFENSARTLPAVRSSRRFAVNILRQGQEDLAARFASKLPEAEKFDGVAHDLADGVPLIGGTLAWLACDLTELIPGGDHQIAIGAVTGLGSNGGGEPLLWYQGGYRGLA